VGILKKRSPSAAKPQGIRDQGSGISPIRFHLVKASANIHAKSVDVAIKGSKGQASVEFALIVILAILAIVAMVNLFLVSLAWLNAQFASREGARASVTMTAFDASTIEGIVDHYFFMSDCSLSNYETPCPEGCCVQIGCCAATDDPCTPVNCTGPLDSYDPVTVRTSFHVPIFIPGVREALGETLQVRGSATMRQERKEEE